ncbi:heterokaryon incompatibility [Pyrenophora seminiperda CCB06]|uniref:Heterokaryon incompatibility n=1 Tax=Pyrenophora seminiperda CCB06 TaxID=1302712 RepID=A0A3M7M1F7_9PLEO|nr:heterokaryon incompatibility [Pyrenophora seminiperda CCB06]
MRQYTDVYVKLVETKDWPDKEGHKTPGHPNVHYVTLSHCWGKNVSHEYKLTSENLATFRDTGIQLRNMPKTFRHAIEFAARLPFVGFIWIDSLCIKQGANELEDWLQQSANMHKVYSETFLNISATASSNSDGGLFFERRPELLLENEIVLNIEGLPGAHKLVQKPIETSAAVPSGHREQNFLYLLKSYVLLHVLVFIRHLHTVLLEHQERRSKSIVKPQTTPDHLNENSSIPILGRESTFVTKESAGFGETEQARPSTNNLRRCLILDTSFWTSRVDQAPVNTRGWVLQERLMASRVLHFCRDQVAWECGEFDAAEEQPQGMQNLQLTADGIVEESSRLKGLNVHVDGKRLRRIRLKECDDPDLHLQPQIYAFELWRRIVEVYSRTAITNPTDKLIALSGLARWMASRIGTADEPVAYVAGLWKLHLASQLLWRVEPVFREVDGTFEHPSTAPDVYRAPSFSWASIDAERGHGITYADTTDQDLFIKVESVSVTPRPESDEYGILNSAHLILHGKLRRAHLYPLGAAKGKGRFGWRFLGRGEALDNEEHTNVYLDCPARDALPEEHRDGIFGLDKGVYVVPAAKGERTASEKSKYVTCLLLQLVRGNEPGPAFRRIGLTKLSPWADSVALHDYKMLDVYGSDVDMPHYQGYDAETGMHRILIV